MFDLQREIARTLLKIGAVGFSFQELITFVSGIKSPVYVDNRRFPFYPDDWQKVIEGFVEIINRENIQFDVIAGIEAGGIPHSASLGYLLKKPSVFIRKQVKGHGIGKRIAGGDVSGKRVLLVEDLVSTGGSSLSGIEALRQEGAEVTDCLIIIGYGFTEANEAFAKGQVQLHSLTSFPIVLDEAFSSNLINKQEQVIVSRFLNNPHNWQDPHVIDKYNMRVDRVGSLLCVGLDSDYEKLPENFKNLEFPQFEFNKAIIEQTHEYAAAYKFNIAFYEARGDLGLLELKKSMDYLRENYPDIFTICDAKRADIGNTNRGYVTSIMDWLGFDAMTLHPYFGREALSPFLERRDKGCIVLCRSSNPGAGEIQDLTNEGRPIWQIVAEKVRDEWNVNNNCLLMIGATYPEEMKKVREIVGDITFLVPGIGAQGGDVEATVRAGINSQGKGMIINSSRGIIFSANPREEAMRLRDEINKYR